MYGVSSVLPTTPGNGAFPRVWLIILWKELDDKWPLMTYCYSYG